MLIKRADRDRRQSPGAGGKRWRRSAPPMRPCVQMRILAGNPGREPPELLEVADGHERPVTVKPTGVALAGGGDPDDDRVGRPVHFAPGTQEVAQPDRPAVA